MAEESVFVHLKSMKAKKAFWWRTYRLQLTFGLIAVVHLLFTQIFLLYLYYLRL
jgi:hypothetical protein